MIVVDTNVWIAHIRSADPVLQTLLPEGEALLHPMVLAELYLGSLSPEAPVAGDLRLLPPAMVADHGEVMRLIRVRRLSATGIGYVDAHLLAATLLTPGARLWTRDRRLHVQAERLGIAFAI